MPCNQVIPVLGIYPKEIKTYAYTLFIIVKTEKKKEMSINWEIHKQNVVYPYNKVLFSNERNELLIHATTCMMFKSITLSKDARHKISHTVEFHVMRNLWRR